MPAALDIDNPTVVVYDVDPIQEGDVDAVLVELGDRKALHLYREDADWPARPDVEARPVWSRRRPELLDYAMARVDDVHTAMRDQLGREGVAVRGIDLLEVARFDLQFAARDAFLRDWLCRQLIAGGVHDVTWFVGGGSYDRAFAEPLAAGLRPHGIAFRIVGRPAVRARSIASLRWRSRLERNSRLLATVVRQAGLRRAAVPIKDRPRVLFVENYPKSAALAASVAVEAQRRGDVDVWFVVTRRDAFDAVRDRGLRRLFLLDELVTHAGWARAVGVSWKANRWRAAAEALSASGSERNRAGGFEGPQLSMIAGMQWQHAAHMTVLMDDVLGRLRPDAVASTSQINTSATAAVAVGRRLGATSFFIQHGLMAHDPFEAHARHQRFLLWGEWDRRRRIALGVAPEDVEVTGPVGLAETLAAVRAENRRDSASAFRVAYLPARSGGTWVSGPNAEKHLQMVVEACDAMPGLELVVKPHPSDGAPMFDRMATRPWMRVVRNVSATAVIAEADLVIVTATSAGLDACALDRPVIVLHLVGERLFSQYAEYDAVLIAKTVTDLRSSIARVRDDEGLRERLRIGRLRMNDDLFAGVKPGAATRMADAIARGALEAASNRAGGSRARA